MSRASRPEHPRPTAVIVIAPDERSAEIVIEGQRQVVTGLAPKETRRAALDVATGYAAHIGQPVLVDARDANGYWRLVATPSGVVQAADQAMTDRSQQPDPGGPSGPAPPRPQEDRKKGGAGRKVLIGGAVALTLLLVAGGGMVVTHIMLGGAAPSAEEEEEPDATGVPLEFPPPPGYADTVDFSEELAPETQPGISRDGAYLAYVDPGDRLNVLGSEGSREWSVELPFEAGNGLGAPRFVQYGGEDSVVMETADTLWFWPVAGGSPTSITLPESGVARYAGDSVLVRTVDSAYLPIDGELAEFEAPGLSEPMLAAGDRALTAVVNGPWQWVEPGGDEEDVHAESPHGAGDMEGVVTALREYVIVRWEAEGGDGSLLAFHDREDGAVLGAAEIEEDALEGVSHLSAPFGTELVAYGPVLFSPATGETAVVPGFTPEITVGSQVFGDLDGERVALDAAGEPSEVPRDAQTPRGLLGDRAVVVDDDHLYAIPPE
ncbi:MULTISPECIES: hypothetical protein [unclassified Nocardiopsis]|uniref:hypothetical protein n=1 Tax=unclassified Nocardiopsis TaxID=2649073 RepID=UPI0033FE9F68